MESSAENTFWTFSYKLVLEKPLLIYCNVLKSWIQILSNTQFQYLYPSLKTYTKCLQSTRPIISGAPTYLDL